MVRPAFCALLFAALLGACEAPQSGTTPLPGQQTERFPNGDLYVGQMAGHDMVCSAFDDTSGGTDVTFSRSSSTSSGVIVHSGEVLIVPSGQFFSGVIVKSGGEIDVQSGGVASGSVAESAGLINVSSGGTASDTIVSGGTELISSGGILNGATLSGGTVEIESGGTAGSSTITISSGTLKLDDCGDLQRVDRGPGDDAASRTSTWRTSTSPRLTLGYSGNTLSGVLSASDGVHTALLNMIGNYTVGSFKTSDDGAGGTLITDPPVSSGATLAPLG